MILGVDVSTLPESRRLGAIYRKHGIEVNPLEDIVVHNGVSMVRLRVWVDPYSEDGEPYLGGTCDFKNYVEVAKEAKALGCGILLDPHFSDFWVDPAKQTLPKAWKDVPTEKLPDTLRAYCKQLFQACKDNGVEPDWIQMGNEITNGILWPYAKLTDGSPRGNYDHLAIALGIVAEEARLAFPKIRRMIHLERSYDNVVYREFFDHIVPKVDFEIIGMSYYPYWHHGFDEMFANLADIRDRYGKAMVIVETGYGFTLEDYVDQPLDNSTLCVTEDSIAEFGGTKPFPLTPEGQVCFIEELLRRAKENGVEAIFYWEPFWIPGDGVCWASRAGQDYIHENKASTRNEWANQCLYDYEGNSLPALEAFSLKK